ncbi:MAG: DUF1887 family CARF protein [Bacteroidales bacterium]|nr:DUF1887 family CARF protein [Bacteroidales bacterium]
MKTLVNIFDPQEPLAAYLFLKQYYQPGDHLVFISTHGHQASVRPYASLFHIPDDHISIIAFQRDEDSYIYERICRRLRSALSPHVQYWVNLAGGTRYSALAVQHVFAQFQAKFFYVQTHENLIVSSFFDNNILDDDDTIDPITYRMSLAEYFELHNLQHDLHSRRHTPIRSFDDALRIFRLFQSRQLTVSAFRALEQLRTYYRGTKNSLSLQALRRGSVVHAQGIAGLDALLREFGFVPAVPDSLQPHEIDYLTGGWFEEYVFYILRQALSPHEIAIGVRISRPGSQHNNELDVVFIKANTLFVVECKTGVATDHMFNEIVYKACALKESFLGMKSYSYIFTLKNDHDHHLTQVADMMGITLCPKSVLTSPKLLAAVQGRMLQQAHEF